MDKRLEEKLENWLSNSLYKSSVDLSEATKLAKWMHEETKSLMDWQPIETAPKDGTTILVYYKFTDGSNFIKTTYWQGDDWFFSGELPLTHWQSLPEPPAKGE